MTGWVDTLTTFTSSHPHWMGGLVFLVAASEAIVLVGYIIPGTPILLTIGGIAGAGHLPLLPILIWAAAGAVAGDGFSYWLGHTYRDGLRQHWPFSRYPDLIDRGETFLHRHGGKSVFLGRFVPVLKPIIPTVAGILGMTPGRFYTANVISAILWSPAHILPGVVVGASLGLLHGVSTRLVIAMLGVMLLLALAIWAGRLAVLGAAPALAYAHRRAYAWAMARPGTVVRRLAGPFDPESPSTPALVVALAILVGASITLAGVLEDVVTHDPLTVADRAISHFVTGLRSDWTDPVAITVTALGDAAVTVPLALTVLAWLAGARQWRLMTSVVISLGASGLAVVGLKAMIHVPRPEAMYSGVDAFAFPSGHTTMAATLYGLAAWLVAGAAGPAGRVLAYAVSFGWMLMVAASRVYLGAHWPSDVLAGLLIGAVVCATVALLYRHASRERLHPTGLSAALAAVFIAAGSVHVTSSFEVQEARYTPPHAPRLVDARAWWQGQTPVLPRFRVDLVGESEESLTIQWLGEAARLRQALELNEWVRPPTWTFTSAAGFLKPDTPIETLPVVTTLHDGAKPAVTLVRPARLAGERIVLRAWDSGFAGVDDGARAPILVGSVVRERLARPWQMLSLPVVDEIVDPSTVELPGAWTRRAPGPGGGEVLRASERRVDATSGPNPIR